MMENTSLPALLLTAALMSQTTAYAQSASDEQSNSKEPKANEVFNLEELIVTARRKAESLQDVPGAISGFGQEELTALDIGNFGDVARLVPNLDVQRQFGSASAPAFYLRGISTGSSNFETDSGIGLYVDGIYLGRAAGSQIDLADVARVEILRGPQGTLYGRNSTGGAINFITSQPSGGNSFKGGVTLGNFGKLKGRVSANLGSDGPWSARVSYLHDENDGYVDNLTPGRRFTFAQPFGTIESAESFGAEETDAISIALRYQTAKFYADYRFDNTEKTSTQLAQQLLGFDPSFAATGALLSSLPGAVTTGPSTSRLDAVALDFTSESDLEITGHSLVLSYQINDGLEFKSITGYRELDEFVGGNDIDGGAFVDFTSTLPFTYISSVSQRSQEQFSQELQLLGETENLSWVLGAFYFEEEGDDNTPVFVGAAFPSNTLLVPSRGPANPGTTINLFGVPSDFLAGSDSSVKNESTAVYAHAEYDFGKFKLASGVRYSEDDRESLTRAAGLVPAFIPQSPPSNFESDNVDFNVTATYLVNPDVITYAKFATGFLSGGVLAGIEFEEETIDSIELGLKGDFLDGRLRLNLLGFVADRENVQTLAFDAASGSFIVSAPNADEKGLEAEITYAVNRNLTLTGTFGYLDQDLGVDPVVGPINSLAPEQTASASIQYDFNPFSDGSVLSARIDALYVSERLSDPIANAATLNLTTLPSRTDINARLSLSEFSLFDRKVSLSAWVKNLTDNDDLEFARNLTTSVIGTFQLPRTYGVDLKFGF